MSIAESLYPYQVPAVDFAASMPGAALFCEQGTGKTFILAALIERLAAACATSTHLLVVPLANIDTTWARVLARVNAATVHRDWVSFRDGRESHRVLLIHYEMFRGATIRKIIKRSWTSATFDESQRLKKRSSKASRGAARIRDVGHRVILSGTPVEQEPQDLWAQLRFAAPDVLGRRWDDFASEWLKPAGYMGYDWKFRDEKLAKFIARVRPVIFRVTRDQVLDLPPVTVVRERVPLLGDQARVYRELSRHQTTVLLGGQRITCDLAVTELVRLQQVCGGFIRCEGGEIVGVGSAKRRRLRVVLSREHARHGPVVVFCNFKQELQTCAEVAAEAIAGCRIEFVRGLRGSKKRKREQRVRVIDAFQAGEIDVLVCQIRAGGVGIDLFRSCAAVFYSLPHSFIDYDQGVSRLARNGQTRPVVIVHLEAENTVDTAIASALLSKRSVSRKVLEDHRRSKMAKPDKKAETKTETKAETKTEAKKPTPPPQPPKPKYGVPELAEAMGQKATSLRVKLRAAGIPKSGKLYGWDTKDEMKKVIDALKARAEKAGKKAEKAGKKEDDEDEDEEDDDAE